MRKFLICLAVIVALTVFGTRAMAMPVSFGDNGVGLQAVLNNITMGPSPVDSSTDVLTDGLSDSMDSYWSFTGFNIMSISIVVDEVTQWASLNTFGVYDAANPMNRVPIFGGSASAGSASAGAAGGGVATTQLVRPLSRSTQTSNQVVRATRVLDVVNMIRLSFSFTYKGIYEQSLRLNVS